MSNSNLKVKNSIKMTFVIIYMDGSSTKSFPNGTFCEDIIILCSLEVQQIKTLPSSVYICSSSDHFCCIYQTYDFSIQNTCLYKYEYIIPFKVVNNGWAWSLYVFLFVNDDIVTYFVCQKLSHFGFVLFDFT